MTPEFRKLDGLRVLLLVDTFSPRASGGMVARCVAENADAEGARVTVLPVRATPPGDQAAMDGVTVLPVLPGDVRDSHLQHLVHGKGIREYRRVLREVRPQVVHLASFEYAKPKWFISEAVAGGSRVVLQPWVHGFFCEQGYDLRGGAACGACAGGAFGNAILHRCGRSIARSLLHAASRASLRKVALGANAVYSTNEHLDHTLRRYGFGSPKIVRGPLPFDSKRLDGWSSTDGEAFVFHGQALAIKGAHLLPGIVKAVPGARFLLAPLRGPHGDEMLARLVALRSARVEVDTGIRWETGLAKRIAGARGVLLPSVWPSTTEYALLEALGWGKPVVAFPVGVNREILVDDENAMVVPTGDVAGFARAVSRLDEDPALRRRLAAGARRTFEALTSTRTIREALVRLYVPDESQG